MTSTDVAGAATGSGVGDGRGLFGTRRWLDAMAARIEGRHELVSVGAGADRVDFFTSVVDESVPASKNPYDVAYSTSDAMRALTDDCAAQLAASAPSRASWFPARIVVLPGLETYATGPGARSSRSLASAVERLEAVSLGERGERCLAFLYTQPEDTALRDVLRARGYAEVPSATRLNARLSGQAYGDYLASLSRSRRRQFTETERRVMSSGWATEPVDIVDNIDRMVELRLAHRARHGRRPDEDGERDLLWTLATRFADVARAVGLVDQRGALVGFTVTVRSGDVLHTWTTAWDERVDGGATAYFATCFNGAIRQAYADGCREVSFGYGSEKQKRHRGARVAYTVMHVLGDGGLMADAAAAGRIVSRGMRFPEDPVVA